MKRLLKLFAISSVLSVLMVMGAVCMAVDNHPAITTSSSLTDAELTRARDLLREHHPERLEEGEIKTVVLSEQELNGLANYALRRIGGVGKFVLRTGELEGLLVLELPKTPFGSFANIRVRLQQTDGPPELDTISVGDLGIPASLAIMGLRRLAAVAKARDARVRLDELVQRGVFSDGHMSVTYAWQSDLAGAVREAVISNDDQQRLMIFQNALADAVGEFEGRTLSLEELTRPMFGFALKRASGEPVKDNQAILIVLSAYINDRPLDILAPDIDGWREVDRLSVIAHRRRDLPKHFLTSAALSATGGTSLSETAGRLKELRDSRGGSGFSFVDLIADQAGTRLGENATSSPASAQRTQERLHTLLLDRPLIPSIQGLPEGLSQKSFKERFESTHSDKYREVVADIEGRISNSPVYE